MEWFILFCTLVFVEIFSDYGHSDQREDAQA